MYFFFKVDTPHFHLSKIVTNQPTVINRKNIVDHTPSSRPKSKEISPDASQSIVKNRNRGFRRFYCCLSSNKESMELEEDVCIGQINFYDDGQDDMNENDFVDVNIENHFTIDNQVSIETGSGHDKRVNCIESHNINNHVVREQLQL